MPLLYVNVLYREKKSHHKKSHHNKGNDVYIVNHMHVPCYLRDNEKCTFFNPCAPPDVHRDFTKRPVLDRVHL